MTQALFRAVGAPGSLGFALTTSIRSSARPTSSWVDGGVFVACTAPPVLPGVAAPVTIAMPPGPDWHITSCLFVPFSSFSMEIWRRLVMIIVFTDDLIWEMRARYGLAAGDLPHGDSPNCSATESN